MNLEISSAQSRLEEKLDLLSKTEQKIDEMMQNAGVKSDIQMMKEKAKEYLYSAFQRQKMAVINDRIELQGLHLDNLLTPYAVGSDSWIPFILINFLVNILLLVPKRQPHFI